MNVDRLERVPDWAWTLGAGALGVALLLALLLFVTRARRAKATPRTGRLDGFLTLLGAMVATGVAGVGMWELLDRIGVTNPWVRIPLFAFLEINLLASALRARRNLRQFGTVGVDGAAVWVIAVLSGTLSALGDANSFTEGLFRFTAPLVAAWGWERHLAPERRAARGEGKTRRRINWAIGAERVLVWLRLAEPKDRAIGDVDRARRLARLARSAFRLHMLRADDAKPRTLRRAESRLRRNVLAAAEHLGLASDDTVRASVRQHLAVLYGAVEGTSPAAVRDLAPWGAVVTVADILDAADPVSAPPADGPDVADAPNDLPVGTASGVTYTPEQAATVARALAATQADMAPATIGAWVGRSERTVKRYLDVPPTNGRRPQAEELSAA